MLNKQPVCLNQGKMSTRTDHFQQSAKRVREVRHWCVFVSSGLLLQLFPFNSVTPSKTQPILFSTLCPLLNHTFLWYLRVLKSCWHFKIYYLKLWLFLLHFPLIFHTFPFEDRRICFIFCQSALAFRIIFLTGIYLWCKGLGNYYFIILQILLDKTSCQSCTDLCFCAKS